MQKRTKTVFNKLKDEKGPRTKAEEKFGKSKK